MENFSRTVQGLQAPQDVDPSQWKIRKVMTLADIAPKRYYLTLNKTEIQEHVLKYWTENKIKRINIDDIKISVKDLDMNSEHIISFGYCQQDDSYCLQGHWRLNFVDRRFLFAGDEIGFNYDPHSDKFLFRVLKRGVGMPKI